MKGKLLTIALSGIAIPGAYLLVRSRSDLRSRQLSGIKEKPMAESKSKSAKEKNSPKYGEGQYDERTKDIPIEQKEDKEPQSERASGGFGRERLAARRSRGGGYIGGDGMRGATDYDFDREE